jgi:NAD(P)-dependent dehydrogenase (short-subunit alcohol dehydrogenase family)
MDISTNEGRRCALVTGAAKGIGRATARLLVEHGWFVGIADTDQPGLALLADELGHANVLALALDVTVPRQWQEALAAFDGRTGRLDVLVNNAGILVSGPFGSSPLERHHALVEVNLKGLISGCWLAKPYLGATAGARVINLSSASAVYGQAALATYSATKFAVRGLTEALNIEWQDDGIRVMDVMPLFVQTDMVQGMQARSIARLGVHLTPEDVARVIWKAICHDGYSKVHWPVGAAAAWLRRLNELSPDVLSRFVARRIAA